MLVSVSTAALYRPVSHYSLITSFHLIFLNFPYCLSCILTAVFYNKDWIALDWNAFQTHYDDDHQAADCLQTRNTDP